MILNFSFKLLTEGGKLLCKCSLYKTYRVASSVPVDMVWGKLINLADMSWHPLFSQTNLPKGLIPKPGLIFFCRHPFDSFSYSCFCRKCPP